MESLNEIYKEKELSPLDEQGLNQIQKHLESLGVTAVRTETGTLRAELKRFGTNYILAHFVSGREVFYRDEHIEAAEAEAWRGGPNPQLRKLQSKQRLWLKGDVKTYSDLAKRIFVVDLDNAAADPQYTAFAQQLELDMQVSLKVLCTLESLHEAIAAPFRPVAHRAFDEPFVHCTRASVCEFDKPIPDFKALVTRLYKLDDFRTMCKQLQERKNRAAVLATASRAFTRIMGASYSLVDTDGDIEMVRGAGSQPMPDFMVGRGELTAMSYCLFLALAHDRVNEGMCIGIKESLNTLDSLRHLKALTVLAEFVIATGASVYFQTDKSDYVHLAEVLLSEATRIASQGTKTLFF